VVAAVSIGGYDVSCQQCACTFFKAFKLPCRHILNYRAVCHVDKTDLSHVPDRWLRQRHTSAHSTGSFAVFNVANSSPRQARTLEQYRKAKLGVNSIASDMAMCGTVEFNSRLQVFKRLQALWHAGKPVLVGDAESDIEPETDEVIGEPTEDPPDLS